MLERAKEVIEDISKVTDEIILMHSLSGKDSIALLDLCYPKFKRVVCVFMFMVPNMEHIKPYYAFAKRRYPNIHFIQLPHYGLFNYRKEGFMGMRGNPDQRKWKLADIIDKVREKTGIEWCCCGFKQSDSLNRRLMLRSYTDGKMAISWSGKKFYPLSTYKNQDILDYIRKERLKCPEHYGAAVQSSGDDITDYFFLKYLEEHYPSDLEKVYNSFPATRLIIEQYENGNYQTKRNKGDKEKSD